MWLCQIAVSLLGILMRLGTIVSEPVGLVLDVCSLLLNVWRHKGVAFLAALCVVWLVVVAVYRRALFWGLLVNVANFVVQDISVREPGIVKWRKALWPTVYIVDHHHPLDLVKWPWNLAVLKRRHLPNVGTRVNNFFFNVKIIVLIWRSLIFILRNLIGLNNFPVCLELFFADAHRCVHVALKWLALRWLLLSIQRDGVEVYKFWVGIGHELLHVLQVADLPMSQFLLFTWNYVTFWS